jgi:hypothetical protein
VSISQKTEIEGAAIGGAAQGVSFLSELPKVRVALRLGVGRYGFHTAWEVAGTAMNAAGEIPKMPVESATSTAIRTLRSASFSIRVPVLSQEAVLATEGRQAWSCVTAALYGIYRGWFP